MVRNVDYEARRRAILMATINKYIKEALPIASEQIADDFDLSSATIRNIFSELEEAGYITHPHTSGGRVPTNKGYRYYVDFLISQMELLNEEKERIVEGYKNVIDRLEDVLEVTSTVISAITHYAGIVSFLERQDKFFYTGINYILEQPEFRDFEKIRLIIKMIEEKKKILDIINRDFSGPTKVYIGEELECPEMEHCSLIVSVYRLKDRPSGRIAVLGPKRMEYRHTIPTLEYISAVLSDTLSKF
ncbi:MAG: DeoR family transcriptional regulator [Candidatus Omnitrophica bacterium]|nr:DeoR family transcriptional regulator [Candidatus Omnitrophota bacterium]